MGTYTRLGSHLLASELASDPFGSVHRAVVIAGSGMISSVETSSRSAPTSAPVSVSPAS